MSGSPAGMGVRSSGRTLTAGRRGGEIVRSFLYALARLMGDIQAIRRGRVGRRLGRRAAGRGLGRLLRRLFR